jgi:hypothetical protein
METPIDLHEVLGPIAFKYCDERGLDIIRNLRLKVTPPLYFNDPFEFTPHVVCSSPNRKFKDFFGDKREQRKLYDQQRSLGYQGTMREFRRELRKMRPELISQGAPRIPEANRALQEKMLSHYSGEHGVVCLSKRSDSLLMWGHYSRAHTGFVVGLDLQWKPFNAANKGMREVEYVRERPKWDTITPLEGMEANRALEKIIFSKNEDWAYEGELRQLFELKCLLKETGKNENSYYLEMPTHVVKCAILGLRTPAELENEVRSILSEEKLSHVSLWKAALHESQFALNFHCIKQGLSGSAREATV